MSNIPYDKEELYGLAPAKTLRGEQLNEVAFPLGGIGTGSISLSGRGQLIDWEIFNKPAKGVRPNETFFSLWAKRGKDEPVFRILEERLAPPHAGERERPYESGPAHYNAAGLPRLREARFTGSYPLSHIAFRDEALPLQVSMEAFNPFIPTNDKDSSIPTAIFLFTLKNPGRAPVKATLAMNAQNMCAHPERGFTRNRYVETKHWRGMVMDQARLPRDDARAGTMALVSPHKRTTWQCQWRRSGWFDPLSHFCNTFVKTGRFDDDKSLAGVEWHVDVASLGLQVTLPPGKSVTLPFILAWHFPWHERYWEQPTCGPGQSCDATCDTPRWRNYYATVWKDARAVADYTVKNLPRLERETRRFHDALHGSTLPAPVLDAASSQMSILKTTTCLRLEDGTFYGWEGCTPNSGCCQGTCTHVWNYAQALPYLFPNLERSIRDSHFAHDLREEDGHMGFRMPLPLGTPNNHNFHAAADGQLGDVMKVYRDWLICGDTKWLRGLWPGVKQALAYTWVEWDADRDGVLEGVHHNTYDIEFHGAEPLAQTFYLGALRAAEEMARVLGDEPAARDYRDLFERGRAKTEKLLWNGTYFHQRMDKDKETRNQYGKGVLSDAMIGQWYATMLGLGHLLDPDKVKRTLAAIFEHNWRADLSEHVNPQRVYALNDEAGLLLCSWPKGGRPEFPFVYSDEVWTGIEYQVAAHLIYEGLVDEGLAIVTGVRRRHDGRSRNPWNEFECGNHYARAMASWSVLLALGGFSYHAAKRRIGFAPRVYADDFRTFFSVEGGWGTLSRKKRGKGLVAEVAVLYGSLDLREVALGALASMPRRVTARLGKQALDVELAGSDGVLHVRLDKQVRLKAGETLTLTL